MGKRPPGKLVCLRPVCLSTLERQRPFHLRLPRYALDHVYVFSWWILTEAEIVATHRFNAEEADWGFTRFCELRRLFSIQWEGRGVPLVQNDEAKVTAYVRVVKDPTGVLWHSFQKYVIFSPLGATPISDQTQLRLQERNRYGGVAKPRSHLLSQLPSTIIIFYQRIQKGKPGF
jgi:hypothetical protein